LYPFLAFFIFGGDTRDPPMSQVGALAVACFGFNSATGRWSALITAQYY